MPERFVGRDVLCFVDNEAACSALVRGSSSSHDVEMLVQAFHVSLASLSAHAWIEWIDSKSNPSDGLSRTGLQDEWTRARTEWLPSEAKEPPWHLFNADLPGWIETLGARLVRNFGRET